jgi:hypothetical protein
VTYSRIAESKTTIGAERFHFRVRNGIGWFPLAVAARETGKSGKSNVERTRFKLKPEMSHSKCVDQQPQTV